MLRTMCHTRGSNKTANLLIRLTEQSISRSEENVGELPSVRNVRFCQRRKVQEETITISHTVTGTVDLQ